MDNNFESGWAYDFEPAPLATLPSAVPLCLDVDLESFGDSTTADSPPQKERDAVKAENDVSFWRYGSDAQPMSVEPQASSSDHESEVDSHSSARVAEAAETAEPSAEEKQSKKFEPVIFESAPVSAPAVPAKQEGKSARKRAVRAVTARSRAAAAAAAAAAAGGSSPSSDDDATPTCKRERNKQSAAKYRKRRKMYVTELEAKVALLESKVQEQTSSLTGLQSENKTMKEQVTFLKKMLNIRNELPNALPSAKKGAVVFALFSFFLLTACPLWELRDTHSALDATLTSHGAAAAVPVRYSNGRALLSLEDRDLECTVTPRASPVAAPSSPSNFTVVPLQSISAAFSDFRLEHAGFASPSA